MMSESIVVMKYLLILSIVSIVIVSCENLNFYLEKPGSCPPPLPLQICSRACFIDGHCQGIGKCCATSCGGSICSRPVTMRPKQQTDKPGLCPTIPTGRWVCSPTCTADNDCQGIKKCCKNRCGALACQKPDVEIIESIEIPVEPQPNDIYSYSNGLNPDNPFLFNAN